MGGGEQLHETGQRLLLLLLLLLLQMLFSFGTMFIFIITCKNHHRINQGHRQVLHNLRVA